MPFDTAVRFRSLSVVFALFICCTVTKTFGTVVLYQASDSTNNFAPDGPDPTPNRPSGEMIGNTVAVLGPCSISGATVKVGTTDTGNVPQQVTMNLYLNDGPADPDGSGLLQPGTLIASATDTLVSLGTGIVPATFSFPSIVVSGTFTFVLSFSPGSSGSAYIGVMTDNSAPQAGSAQNTLWYGSGAAGGWATNNTWAIADGGVTNYLDATFVSAVPEPRSMLLMVFGSAGIFIRNARIRRSRSWPRRRQGADRLNAGISGRVPACGLPRRASE